MKKTMMTVLFAAALMGGPWMNDANAACNSIVCDGKVQTVYVHANGKAFVQMDQDYSPLYCDPLEGRYLELKSSIPVFKEIYSLLLSAWVSGKTVRIRMNETPGQACEIWWVQGL